jgi:hypothetical protein
MPGGNLLLSSGVVRFAMELLLNILGTLIALGLLGTWRTRWVHQRHGSSRRSLQEWSAVSLALVLLFFAVSMTDDLHSEIVALEECLTSKRESICQASAHALPQSGTVLHAPSWAIRRPIPFFVPSSLRRELEQSTQVGASFLPSDDASSRAPPFCSCSARRS